MGGGGVKVVLGEAIPSAAMVLVEGCIIVLTIMASTAMARGMSPFVFVVYTNALSTIILLPYSYYYHRDRSDEPLLRFPFLLRVFILGLIGVTISQNLAFVGLSYSSPIVACGMANQIPALSFILGIILRNIKINWRSSGSRARIIGIFISFAGAISLTLYQGPTVKNHSSPSLSAPAQPRLLVFTSPHQNWVLGCILFAASSVSLTIWNVVQVGTLKICSQVMKVVSFYSLFGTIQSAALAMYWERDLSAWRLDFNFELLIIVLTAVFGSLVRTNVQMWCSRVKGPYFVPAFKPFGIPYASTFGSLFFGDTFHYGSMMAAFICGVGYYTSLWGQITDEETQKSNQSGNNNKIIIVNSSDETKVPLLQEEDEEESLV